MENGHLNRSVSPPQAFMVDNNVTYITSGTEDRPAVTMTSGCIGLDLADWLLVGGSVGCWLVDRLTG